MKSIKLKKDIYWIGAVDYDLREFDVVLNTKMGTTYNSYLVIGSEKTAIIDTVKANMIDEYLEKLDEVINIKAVDYLIINHAEPDHTGSINKLLTLNPNLTIVGSKMALNNVREITNMEFKWIIAKEGVEISLGNKTFSFINAIMLHWPDTMYSYLKEDKVLFTCDSFGAHYAMEVPLQSKIKNEKAYLESFHYYFNHIFKPFKMFYLKAIKKIADLEIAIVAVGHGPILDSDPWKVINYTKELALEVHKNPQPLIVIPYVSSYGYTEFLANQIEEKLLKEGFLVEKYDMTYTKTEDVIKRLIIADGILFGSPTILGDALLPIWEVLNRLNPFEHGIKKGSVFGSYGWSGEGVNHVDTRLKQLRMKTIPPLKIKFKASKEDSARLSDYVQDFINLMNE